MSPEQTPEKPKWMTVAEAAEYLGICQSTIYKNRGQGRLPPSVQFGGKILFNRADIEEFVQRRTVDAFPPEVWR